MSFMTLSPPEKRHAGAGVERIAATIRKVNDGVRVYLSLSKAVMTRLDHPTRADIQIGSDNHAGMLRLNFNAMGAFEVVTRKFGDGQIYLPALPGIVAEPRQSTACRIATFEPPVIVARLSGDWVRRMAA